MEHPDLAGPVGREMRIFFNSTNLVRDIPFSDKHLASFTPCAR